MGKRAVSRLTLLRYTCAVLGVAAVASQTAAQCADNTVMVRDDGGSSVQFTVEVADTNAERARGLMFVEEMAPTQGMLFVYDRPQSVSFWMRNTLIPLDMVFVGADGEIDSIHANAVPLDETAIFGGDEIQFVLEINGGMAALLGLEAGDQMQHPSFGPDAVWACTTPDPEPDPDN